MVYFWGLVVDGVDDDLDAFSARLVVGLVTAGDRKLVSCRFVTQVDSLDQCFKKAGRA